MIEMMHKMPFGHATPLIPVSALHDDNGIVSGIMVFIKDKTTKMRNNMTFLVSDTISIGIV